MTEIELRDRVFALLPHVTEVNPSDNFIELTHKGTVLIDSYKEELKDEGQFNAMCHLTCHLYSRAKEETKGWAKYFEEEN